VIVVDAGVWVRALIDDGPAGESSRQVLTDDPEWAAPAHTPVEVLRTIRRYEQAGLIETEHAEIHAAAVGHAEVFYVGPEPWLLAAVWGHRHNISPYDAPYVAIAQRHNVTLVTLDQRLARAAISTGADVHVPAPHPAMNLPATDANTPK
jgi:predicted nucleic acid-binding protein